VRKVLVDEAAAIDKEIYFSITNDRPPQASNDRVAAAMEIEDVAARHRKIIKLHIDPLLDCAIIKARDIAAFIDLPRDMEGFQ